MMSGNDVAKQNLHVIRLGNRADILRGLTEELARRGIVNGVIVCGIGSTTSGHIHVVKSTALPPGNFYFEHPHEPFDVVGMQGYVMGGRVHAHISLARATDASQIGGHLEEGCEVLTFCVITVMETEPLGDLDTF